MNVTVSSGPPPKCEWRSYQMWRDAFVAILDLELFPAAWLDGEVAAGRMRLLCGEGAAILFSIRRYPTGVLELHGEAATGNLGEIVRQLIPQAEAFGRMQGCNIAVIQSREGWARAMKRYGYSLNQTTIRKAL